MVWVVWQLVRFPDLLPPHSCKSGNLTAWQLKGSSLCRIEPQQKPSWCGGQQSGSPKCTHQPHYMHYFVSLMPVTRLTVFPGSTKLLLRAPIDWSFIWIRLQVHKILFFFFLFSFFFFGKGGGVGVWAVMAVTLGAPSWRRDKVCTPCYRNPLCSGSHVMPSHALILLCHNQWSLHLLSILCPGMPWCPLVFPFQLNIFGTFMPWHTLVMPPFSSNQSHQSKFCWGTLSLKCNLKVLQQNLSNWHFCTRLSALSLAIMGGPDYSAVMECKVEIQPKKSFDFNLLVVWVV